MGPTKGFLSDPVPVPVTSIVTGLAVFAALLALAVFLYYAMSPKHKAHKYLEWPSDWDIWDRLRPDDSPKKKPRPPHAHVSEGKLEGYFRDQGDFMRKRAKRQAARAASTAQVRVMQQGGDDASLSSPAKLQPRRKPRGSRAGREAEAKKVVPGLEEFDDDFVRPFENLDDLDGDDDDEYEGDDEDDEDGDYNSSEEGDRFSNDDDDALSADTASGFDMTDSMSLPGSQDSNAYSQHSISLRDIDESDASLDGGSLNGGGP